MVHLLLFVKVNSKCILMLIKMVNNGNKKEQGNGSETSLKTLCATVLTLDVIVSCILPKN